MKLRRNNKAKNQEAYEAGYRMAIDATTSAREAFDAENATRRQRAEWIEIAESGVDAMYSLGMNVSNVNLIAQYIPLPERVMEERDWEFFEKGWNASRAEVQNPLSDAERAMVQKVALAVNSMAETA